MPRILTQDLVPGMIISEDVYTYNNQLILPKDMVLTDKAITKLEFYSILSVRIKEETANITPESVPQREESFSEKIKAGAEYKKFKKNLRRKCRNLQLFDKRYSYKAVKRSCGHPDHAFGALKAFIRQYVRSASFRHAP